MVNLLSACLRAGHYLRPVVYVIPKSNRADYTLANDFRPISLLECLGKLQEMAQHALVHTTQCGGRNASSALDAGLTLLHDIQGAHQAGPRTGLLLFDIHR
jgi:hypothetical protein